MAAAGKVKMYALAKKKASDGTFDFDSNTWKVALFASTSNANTLTNTVSILGDLTNELSTANGYTAGGVTVAATWVEAAGVLTFDLADAVWTASGGSITARFAVIYASGTLNTFVNPLLGVCLLDTAPADVSATSGNTFTIQWSASGLLQMSGATVD